MLYLLYDICLALAALVAVPLYLARGLKTGRFRQGVPERFGFLSPAKVSALSRGGSIWIHAVSVGESIAVRSLVASLRRTFPDRPIVFSTVTETGREISEKIPGIDVRIYFPFDFGFAVARVFRAVRPSLVIIAETEIWPNFLREAQRRSVPVLLANGRISDRSFGRYLRFRSLLSGPLSGFSRFCMQTEIDRERIVLIGAPPERAVVAGNLKYDIPPVVPDADTAAEFLARFRVPGGVPVFTAASTHRGEEEIIASVYRKLLDSDRQLFLVIVPRHPERGPEVAEVLSRAGISFSRRTDPSSRVLQPGEALLVDTVGEMMDLYSISDIVFVGGSLVPTGGHNILEPASRKLPVLFGPHMENFREIEGLILGSGGGISVSDGNELLATVERLLSSEEERRRIGRLGVRILEENAGATQRHLAEAIRLLEGR